MMDSNHHKQSQRRGTAPEAIPPSSAESVESGSYQNGHPPENSGIQASGRQKGRQNERTSSTMTAAFRDAEQAFIDALENGATLDEAKGEFRAVMEKRGW